MRHPVLLAGTLMLTLVFALSSLIRSMHWGRAADERSMAEEIGSAVRETGFAPALATVKGEVSAELWLHNLDPTAARLVLRLDEAALDATPGELDRAGCRVLRMLWNHPDYAERTRIVLELRPAMIDSDAAPVLIELNHEVCRAMRGGGMVPAA